MERALQLLCDADHDVGVGTTSFEQRRAKSLEEILELVRNMSPGDTVTIESHTEGEAPDDRTFTIDVRSRCRYWTY